MRNSFLLGAATAAHQVEGNNTNSDVWAMEHMKNSSYQEPSLDAVDHYNRFEGDIALMANAGLNAFRFSIEWARVEPKEGVFSEEAISHYRRVLKCCKANGIEPIVTLHHFSSPKWLIEKGGWECEDTAEYFARYCAFVAKRLGCYMHYVCTINEANMGVEIASFAEKMKGSGLQIGLNANDLAARAKMTEAENERVFGRKDPAVFLSARTAFGDGVIIKAHQKAKAAIKAIDSSLKVGITLSLHDIQVLEGGEELAEREWNTEFSHYADAIKEDDFIGVQNYTRTVIGKEGTLPPAANAVFTQMGYEFYPEALEHVVRRVYHEIKIPVLITENGVASENDELRVEFIHRALQGVKRCLNDGVPVLGYLHWSLLDNFEWQKGYGMKFGLVGVDRATQQRIPKQSLLELASYAGKLL